MQVNLAPVYTPEIGVFYIKKSGFSKNPTWGFVASAKTKHLIYFHLNNHTDSPPPYYLLLWPARKRSKQPGGLDQTRLLSMFYTNTVSGFCICTTYAAQKRIDAILLKLNSVASVADR